MEPRSTLHLLPNTDPILFPHSSTQRKTRPGAPVSSLGKALGSRRHLSSGWREKCNFHRTAPRCSHVHVTLKADQQTRARPRAQGHRDPGPAPGVSLPSRHWCLSHLPETPLVTVQFPWHAAGHVAPGGGQMRPPALYCPHVNMWETAHKATSRLQSGE